MTSQELKLFILDTATELASRGAGWAQQAVVLREVANRLKGQVNTLRTQQAIVRAWHELFLEKKLSWGYDLDNPDSPFFHVPTLAPEEETLSASGV